MAHVVSVNIGSREPNPHKRVGWTGARKVPAAGRVAVRVPGPSQSGLDDDFIGDRASHGGPDQAVYAFAREVLDRWEERLGRELPDGFFGENLTTAGLDVDQARLGERWRVGDTLELVVTVPRLPCSTFRGVMGEQGWLKTFTADARPGAYLAVAVPGSVRRGDRIEVVHRPDHDVTIATAFRALTTERGLLPSLLAAGADLTDELAATVRGSTS